MDVWARFYQRGIVVVVLAALAATAGTTAGQPTSLNGIWSQVPPPTSRLFQVGIHDPVRDRLIIHGGLDPVPRTDTWALQLGFSPSWNELVTSGPLPEFIRAAVYDPVRDRMIVFGGDPLQFWELRLASAPTWIPLPTSGSPTASGSHALVYDPVRDRIIDVTSHDTWALPLNGPATWSQLTPSWASPPKRRGHTAVYDPMGDRIVVFGGEWCTGTECHIDYYLNDVWSLDLNGPMQWVELTPTGPIPSERYLHTTVLDAARNRMVISGGRGTGSFELDAWALNLSGTPAWTHLATTGPQILGRIFHTAIYEASGDRLVVFGGQITQSSGEVDTSNEVWALDMSPGGEWQLLLSPVPVARFRPSAIHDPGRRRMIVFGGYPRQSSSWALSLVGEPFWTPVVPSGPPPAPRDGHSAIHDPIRDRMIVFGGFLSPSGKTNELWNLALGETPVWTLLSPAGSSPAARGGHTAVYDPSRDRMIMHGGLTGAPANDTWILSLNGLAWSELNVTGPLPPARFEHSTIFDPLGNRMIVFGGWSGGPRNDVWTLSFSDPPSWNLLVPGGSPPPPRSGHSAIYDSSRRRMVIWGGNPSGDELDDVWSLSLGDNVEWTELLPAGEPPVPRYGHRAIYDSDSDRMVAFAGYNCDNYCAVRNDALFLQWGCPDSAGGPFFADCEPTAVLVSFAANRSGGDVRLAWMLADAAGAVVHVLRAELGGSPIRLTSRPLNGNVSSFRDAAAPEQELQYWLEVATRGGRSEWHGPIHVAAVAPRTELEADPTLFSGTTVVQFRSVRAGPVNLSVFDASGRLVRVLIDGTRAAGLHRVPFSGKDGGGRELPSGVYHLRLLTSDAAMTRSVVLVR